MKAAASSCRTWMKRISSWRLRNASIKPLTPSPGIPNTVSTPQSSRHWIMTSAAVLAMGLLLGVGRRCGPARASEPGCYLNSRAVFPFLLQSSDGALFALATPLTGDGAGSAVAPAPIEKPAVERLAAVDTPRRLKPAPAGSEVSIAIRNRSLGGAGSTTREGVSDSAKLRNYKDFWGLPEARAGPSVMGVSRCLAATNRSTRTSRNARPTISPRAMRNAGSPTRRPSGAPGRPSTRRAAGAGKAARGAARRKATLRRPRGGASRRPRAPTPSALPPPRRARRRASATPSTTAIHDFPQTVAGQFPGVIHVSVDRLAIVNKAASSRNQTGPWGLLKRRRVWGAGGARAEYKRDSKYEDCPDFAALRGGAAEAVWRDRARGGAALRGARRPGPRRDAVR